jgi:hypothetical protein
MFFKVVFHFLLFFTVSPCLPKQLLLNIYIANGDDLLNELVFIGPVNPFLVVVAVAYLALLGALVLNPLLQAHHVQELYGAHA